MRKFVPFFAVAVILFGAVAAYAGSVSMQDNSYGPSTITIDRGASVTWANVGQLPHDVTADNGSFASGNRAPGQSYTRTFNAAGTFPYYCTLHGSVGGVGMAGRVVVRARTAASAGQPSGVGGGLATTGTDWEIVLVAIVFMWAGKLLVTSTRRTRRAH